MNVITTALASFKAFSRMQWSRTASFFSMFLGSTELDYRAMAGDGRGSAAVMACIRFVQKSLPEAPLVVMTRNAQGELKPAPDHPLQLRLESPNPYYSGIHLLGAVVADLLLTGNAYLVKIRSADKRVQELWWVPSSLLEPAWPDSQAGVFISHYDYRIGGDVVAISVDDVVHIRDFPDPQNIRKGLSPLASLYREIATDNEAANWTAAMVRQTTPPGVVVTPGKDVNLTPENAESIKAEFSRRFGGDNRGSALVLSAEANVQVLSFSPEQMNLRQIRSIPEERITAVLGLPAAVVGLGTGLENTKVGATMAEMREQAFENCIIPLQRLIVAELQRQLVPDFGDPARLRVQFDLSQVRVLQDDQNALHDRVRADLAGGLITLNQALGMIGEDPVEGEAGDVRYIPSNVSVKTLDTLIPDPALAQPAQQPPPALPAADQPALPEPKKSLVGAGAATGHANGKAAAVAAPADIGPALHLTNSDLDRLSQVGPDDLGNAERFWRSVTEGSGLEDLIDAEPEGED